MRGRGVTCLSLQLQSTKAISSEIKQQQMKQLSKGSNPLKPKFKPIQIDKSKELLLAFTDGGCWPNNPNKPNKGGYAFCIVEKDQVLHEYSRGEKNTTNNRMELQGIIDCLIYVEENVPADVQVLLHSDSQYCIHGICTWRHNWKKKGWNGIKNPEQWKHLSELVDRNPNVQYKWVRGHQEGDHTEARWNAYVDTLCTQHITGKREEDKPVDKLPIVGSIELGPTLEERLKYLEYQVERLQETVALMDRNVAIQIDALQTDVRWLNQNITIA